MREESFHENSENHDIVMNSNLEIAFKICERRLKMFSREKAFISCDYVLNKKAQNLKLSKAFGKSFQKTFKNFKFEYYRT